MAWSWLKACRRSRISQTSRQLCSHRSLPCKFVISLSLSLSASPSLSVSFSLPVSLLRSSHLSEALKKGEQLEVLEAELREVALNAVHCPYMHTRSLSRCPWSHAGAKRSSSQARPSPKRYSAPDLFHLKRPTQSLFVPTTYVCATRQRSTRVRPTCDKKFDSGGGGCLRHTNTARIYTPATVQHQQPV